MHIMHLYTPNSSAQHVGIKSPHIILCTHQRNIITKSITIRFELIVYHWPIIEVLYN
jgi:hypothetical protein